MVSFLQHLHNTRFIETEDRLLVVQGLKDQSSEAHSYKRHYEWLLQEWDALCLSCTNARVLAVICTVLKKI